MRIFALGLLLFYSCMSLRADEPVAEILQLSDLEAGLQLSDPIRSGTEVIFPQPWNEAESEKDFWTFGSVVLYTVPKNKAVRIEARNWQASKAQFLQIMDGHLSNLKQQNGQIDQQIDLRQSQRVLRESPGDPKKGWQILKRYKPNKKDRPITILVWSVYEDNNNYLGVNQMKSNRLSYPENPREISHSFLSRDKSDNGNRKWDDVEVKIFVRDP